MTTPTRAERDEMRALLAKATPGPWRLEPPSTGFPGYIVQGAEWSGEVATVQADPGRAQCLANAQAIEILRNRAEALLDALDRAEATIARLTGRRATEAPPPGTQGPPHLAEEHFAPHLYDQMGMVAACDLAVTLPRVWEDLSMEQQAAFLSFLNSISPTFIMTPPHTDGVP